MIHEDPIITAAREHMRARNLDSGEWASWAPMVLEAMSEADDPAATARAWCDRLGLFTARDDRWARMYVELWEKTKEKP